MNATRRYDPTARQEKAQLTRHTILDAAANLLEKEGFDGTTVPGIAEAAGVAVPTVYAHFASKAGIVLELLTRARFGAAYSEAVRQALNAGDPASRLRRTVAVARAVYDGERRLLDLWCGADILSPTLAQLVSDAGETRRDNQASTVEFLVSSKALIKGMHRETARDILWSLTSRELYRLLTVQRGWSSEEYERHVGDLVVSALVPPSMTSKAGDPDRPARRRA